MLWWHRDPWGFPHGAQYISTQHNPHTMVCDFSLFTLTHLRCVHWTQDDESGATHSPAHEQFPISDLWLAPCPCALFVRHCCRVCVVTSATNCGPHPHQDSYNLQLIFHIEVTSLLTTGLHFPPRQFKNLLFVPFDFLLPSCCFCRLPVTET